MNNKIRYLLAIYILIICAPLQGRAAETVLVGGYEFAPFVQRTEAGGYEGATLDLIALLNQYQKDYIFAFRSTLPDTRYQAFDRGRFDALFFENKQWGWAGYNIASSEVFLRGVEVCVALKDTAKNQDYFASFVGKRMIGVRGYHYGIANFNADPDVLENDFNFVLTTSNANSMKLLEFGRGDVAIVTLSFLKMYLDINPELKGKLLVSDKLDQEYAHSVLIREGLGLKVGLINIWLKKLDEEGLLDPLWKKWGLDAFQLRIDEASL